MCARVFMFAFALFDFVLFVCVFVLCCFLEGMYCVVCMLFAFCLLFVWLLVFVGCVVLWSVCIVLYVLFCFVLFCFVLFCFVYVLCSVVEGVYCVEYNMYYARGVLLFRLDVDDTPPAVCVFMCFLCVYVFFVCLCVCVCSTTTTTSTTSPTY